MKIKSVFFLSISFFLMACSESGKPTDSGNPGEIKDFTDVYPYEIVESNGIKMLKLSKADDLVVVYNDESTDKITAFYQGQWSPFDPLAELNIPSDNFSSDTLMVPSGEKTLLMLGTKPSLEEEFNEKLTFDPLMNPCLPIMAGCSGGFRNMRQLLERLPLFSNEWLCPTTRKSYESKSDCQLNCEQTCTATLNLSLTH